MARLSFGFFRQWVARRYKGGDAHSEYGSGSEAPVGATGRCGRRAVHHYFGRRHGSVPPLRLRLAASFWRRAAGLFLLRDMGPHEGLWLRPCSAVHTFGMRRAIDVVFMDRRGRILKTVHALHPNRAAWCEGADSVVELPAFYCRRHGRYDAALRRAMRAGR